MVEPLLRLWRTRSAFHARLYWSVEVWRTISGFVVQNRYPPPTPDFFYQMSK